MADPAPRDIVVVITNFFAPAVKAGGPVQSLAALTRSEIGPRVRVLAGDRDLGDALPMPGVERARWTPSAGGQVRYFDAGSLLTPWRAWRELRRLRPGHVYVNSLFSVPTALLPLLLYRIGLLGRTCLVVAPRGQLDPGALAIGATKKGLVLRLLLLLRLLDGVRWHATSDVEERHIRVLVGPSAEVCTALPVPPRPGEVTLRTRPSTPLRLLFLSRISPKKGLSTLLQALASVVVPVRLDVFGPQDDLLYAQRCEVLVERLTPLHEVAFHGPVPHDRVAGLMSGADAFVLPTHGENFGHAIYEALSAGCPVVVTPTTPWTQAVQGGAGWLVPPGDVPGLAALIEDLACQSPAAMRHTSERALSAARSYRCRAAGEDGWGRLFSAQKRP